MFRHDESLWKGNFDDATRFPAGVETYWTESYMQRSFMGWGGSEAEPDAIWVGIMGNTRDGRSWIGRVPDERQRASSGPTSDEKMGNGLVRKGKKKQQWMLAGFNGGGMAQIATAARAVAKMVFEDLDFEDVKGEFGLLGGCGTDVDRLRNDMK